MALKKTLFELRNAGYDVAADEVDFTRQYTIMHPSVDPTWFGTAVGTQTQSKVLVLINSNADYPRNAVYSLAAAAGSVTGGTLVVNGKDQFGINKTETVAIAPAVGGGTVAGTQIWSKMTTGTANLGTGDAGNGSARIGVAIGTAAGLVHWFGLPDKIGSTADVKFFNWVNNGTTTTFNGGTIGANLKTNSGTPSNAFQGTAIVAVTDRLVVTYKSSYSAEENQVLL